MTAHDAINAIFEGGGAVFLCLNVRRLLRDKSVKGVSLLTTSWWTAWGFWNVYFYSAVNTPASFYAGIAVVLVNAAWLALAVYYSRWPDGPNPPTLPLGPPLGPRPERFGGGPYAPDPSCDCGACRDFYGAKP